LTLQKTLRFSGNQLHFRLLFRYHSVKHE
jgi:hypothetical protein